MQLMTPAQAGVMSSQVNLHWILLIQPSFVPADNRQPQGDSLGCVILLNGPAGRQLGTSDQNLLNRLGPVDYPVGVITGNRSINLILSLLISGDDGKVSIERVKLVDMADFLVVSHTHPMIMDSDEVIRQTHFFLRNGRFDRVNH